MTQMNQSGDVPYRRPTVTGWLAPTFVGPCIAAIAAVGLYGWAGPLHELVPRGAFVVVALIFGLLWAGVYGLVTALVDVALLALKLRVLPSGARAWLASIVAPLTALAAYAVYSPHKWYKFGPWAIVTALAVPLLASCVAGRIAGGKRP